MSVLGSTLSTITTVGTAAQVVATTAYSVGTSVATGGKRYACVRVKCNTVFTLYGYGGPVPFASAAGAAPTTGYVIPSATLTGLPATSADGVIYYMWVAGNSNFLPVLYQSSGGNATVTMNVSFFDA